MVFFDSGFIIQYLVAATLIYLAIRYIFGVGRFVDAAILTLIGIVLFPLITQSAEVVTLGLVLIGGAMIVQFVYNAPLSESVALAVIAILAGSYLVPML